MRPFTEPYVPAARVLHWTVAILVLVVWPVGFVIGYVKDDVKPAFYLVHESLGFLVLWLMAVRLFVRVMNPPPPAPDRSPAVRYTSGTVHVLLYVALIAQASLGFLATNAFGFPLEWFGLVTVWSPIGKSDALAPLFGTAHYLLGWSILVLFALHMGGVLYHHVVKRDETLQRML
ncbi:MAG: cytochrome b [Rhizobiaceae bacterium]|nr:cytochrome b [Rhizobiaceae bacterium]